jgi:hypothetical protein
MMMRDVCWMNGCAVAVVAAGGGRETEKQPAKKAEMRR